MHHLAVPDIDTSSDFDRRMDLGDRLGLSGAVWSIFEVIDTMDDVAIEGKGLTMAYVTHWGPKPVSESLPDNPTWRQLAHASARLVVASGDQHHVFIELFEVNGATLTLVTGS